MHPNILALANRIEDFFYNNNHPIGLLYSKLDKK